MAAAWKKLFSKSDTTDTRKNSDFYFPAGGGSSTTSTSRSRSSSSTDSNPPPRRSSWLKRKASKVSSMASMTARNGSTRGSTKLSKTHTRSYLDSSVPSWRCSDTFCPSIHTAPRGGPDWSFAALDEASSSGEDLRAAVRESLRGIIDVAESSTNAEGRLEKESSTSLDEMPSNSRSTPRRTGSNSSQYRNRFSAMSTKWTKVEEEEEHDFDAYTEGSRLRGGGEPLNSSGSDGLEALPGPSTTLTPVPTGSPKSSVRTKASLYRERLARWSEYSHIADTEHIESADLAAVTQVISEEQPSDTSSEEEHWWSEEEGHEDQTGNTTTQISVERARAYPKNNLNKDEQANAPDLLSVPIPVREAETDSLYEDRPSPAPDERPRPLEHAAEDHVSNQEQPPAETTEQQIRQLEEAARQIDEQVMQLTESLIRRVEDGGTHLDEVAISLAEEELRSLEELGQHFRAEIERLARMRMTGETLSPVSDATTQEEEDRRHALRIYEEILAEDRGHSSTTAEREELDRQHALRLYDEMTAEDERHFSISPEQEELDRQHALQLQQDMQAEQEEAQRQAEEARTRDCTVCAETKRPIDFPITSPTERCQHPPGLCHTCLQSWMASELDSKGCDGFKCPECPEKMSFEEVREAASEETFAAYDKLAMRSALGGLEEFAWCLRSGCGNGQLNIENNHYMICQACGYRQCLKHQIEWHRGETCDEYDYRISGRKAADEARERAEAEDRSRREEERKRREEAQRKKKEEQKTAAMIGTVSKACPANCGRRIQRNQGCDHMTCKCGFEFCWECLAPHKAIDRVGNTAHEPRCKNHSNNVR